MSELKFIITGTAGVGKTTAITTLSDIPPITTDEATTDELSELKSTTTTAFDFGEILIDDDTTVRIYGTPGQERFKHMWEILANGALGLIILVDHSRPDPLQDMEIYLENFSNLVKNTGVVVGVTRLEEAMSEELDKYYETLEKKGIHSPVMLVDPRNKEDMTDLMDTLMTYLEHTT